MSTRSLIGMERKPNGWIDFIYCHSDGNPIGVGAILQEHYQDPEKIKQLIALGSLSSIGPEIGVKQDFNNPDYLQCNAFYRDRGQDWITCKPQVARTWQSFLKQKLDQDYCYVWQIREPKYPHDLPGYWYYTPTGFDLLRYAIPDGWTPAWSKPGYVDPFKTPAQNPSLTAAEPGRVLRITPEETHASG